MPAPLAALLAAARDAEDLPSWRRDALGVLRTRLPFDAAIFHELSPRAPLSGAALIGIDSTTIAAGQGQWDENAVLLGRLRDLALKQGGAATDTEAFPPRTRWRRAWHERVAGPLSLRHALVGHLVARRRIISVVFLGRRRLPAFDAAARRALARLLPALSVGDALAQALGAGDVTGPAAALECVDQRLTPRQREVVVHVALGHTNRAAAQALGISEHTVRNLLAQACGRLGAANRAEVVRLAVLR